MPSNKQYLIVVDIESMGTKPGCIVTEIGAVALNLAQPVDSIIMSFEEKLDYTSSKRAGFKADKKTVDWWMRQLDLMDVLGGNRRVAEARFAEKWRNPSSIRKSLMAFTSFYEDIVTLAGGADNVFLVGNDIDFDKCILEHYYTALNLPVPWHYRAWLSLPTVVWLVEYLTGVNAKTKVRETWKTVHSGLDDARQEAAMLNTAFDLLKGFGYNKALIVEEKEG